MAAPQYDVESLIANVKRRCAVPTSQLTYTDEDFTALCTDELQGEVVPLIMSTREEFFVEPRDVSSPADGVIAFPSDTVASKVRSVCYVQQTSPLLLINLPRIDLDVVSGVGFSNFNTLAGFYIQGSDLVLYPNTSVPVGTQIRIYLYKRTLVLAAPLAYGKVVSIDSGASTVVLDYVPTTWEVGTVLNSVTSTSPFGISNEELTVVALSDPTVELDTVEGIAVGDFISEQGYSAIPQVPIEAHAYLAQLVAAKCLEGLGDNDGMKVALAKAEQLKTGLLTMISQRVDGSVKKIMAPTGGLRLGAGLGRFGRGGFGVW